MPYNEEMETKTPESWQWLRRVIRLKIIFICYFEFLKNVSLCQFKGFNKIFKCNYTDFH